MIAELMIYLGLGVLLGYVLGNPKARAKLLSKLNDWTKPKKETPPKGDKPE